MGKNLMIRIYPLEPHDIIFYNFRILKSLDNKVILYSNIDITSFFTYKNFYKPVILTKEHGFYY